MSDASLLLRMLEPAVRPGNLPGPSRTPVAPVEQRDFESLLTEATALDERVSETDEKIGAERLSGSVEKAQANPLARMGGLSGVENESLRQILAMHDRGAGLGMQDGS